MPLNASIKPKAGYIEIPHDHPRRCSAEPLEPLDVFKALSRLLARHRSKHQGPGTTFNPPRRTQPYIIGISGSVAVGKSSFSRYLAAALAKWDERPSVQLVTTDSFLYPLGTLRERDLLSRKGFPESYNRPLIFDFLRSIRRGESYKVPIYCHREYDVIAGEYHHIQSPDILILEGLNVCQIDHLSPENILGFVDFSIYLDAPEYLLKSWYMERFIRLKTEAMLESQSYFSRFRNLSTDQAMNIAADRWDQINRINLLKHILPSRDNADLIIEKSAGHRVERLLFRVA